MVKAAKCSTATGKRRLTPSALLHNTKQMKAGCTIDFGSHDCQKRLAREETMSKPEALLDAWQLPC